MVVDPSQVDKEKLSEEKAKVATSFVLPQLERHKNSVHNFAVDLYHVNNDHNGITVAGS